MGSVHDSPKVIAPPWTGHLSHIQECHNPRLDHPKGQGSKIFTWEWKRIAHQMAKVNNHYVYGLGWVHGG